MKKGERKREENLIKNGEEGLKNASFWVINSRFASPAANLFVGGKKRGGVKCLKFTIYIPESGRFIV